MKIQAKKGFEIEVEISGYRNEPAISVSPFSVGGRRHPGGKANIQHWKDKELDRGLFLDRPRAYIQIADMSSIDAAIAGLPEKVNYIHLEKHTVNADGDEIEVEKWHHDGLGFYKIDGYTVSASQMENFLESKGIRKIECGEAVRLFEAEHDMADLAKRRREAEYRVQAAYDDDAAEEGAAQARENWGTRFVR